MSSSSSETDIEVDVGEGFDVNVDYQGKNNRLPYNPRAIYYGLNYLQKMFPGETCVLRKNMRSEGLRPKKRARTSMSTAARDKMNQPPFEFKGKTRCTLEVQPWVRESLLQCPKRFIIAFLLIDCGTRLHANALIFDNKERRIVRYEPNYVGPFSDLDDLSFNRKLDAQMRDWTDENIGDLYTYAFKHGVQNLVESEEDIGKIFRINLAESTKLCNFNFKFADTENAKYSCRLETGKGYCVTWALLFLHMRLANPNLSEPEMLYQLRNYGPEELMRLVTMYANVVGFEVGVEQ